VKNSILLMAVAGVILLGGCSLLKDLKHTASENMEIDKKLPKYNLNMENFKEISYEGKTYVIQEAEVTKEDLDEPIGKVTETITINENNEILSKKELKKVEVVPKEEDEKRTHLNYGWVYSIKDVSPDEEVAVVINNQFRVAKIKLVDE
jgi:hypothetical protein